MRNTRFRNRQDAGRRLAEKLQDLPDDVMVVALPRGGAPVAAPAALAELRSVADEVIALEAPAAFEAIGKWYADFGQVSDTAVAEILEDFDGHAAATGVKAARSATAREIGIDLGPTSPARRAPA